MFLAGVTLGAYAPLWDNDFVNYDDPDYVTANYHVRRGLTWAGARWALTTDHAKNWHPLTWLSHMADVSAFGLEPVGHHAVNLVLHVLAGVGLFLVLDRATGALWPSAIAAALYLVHPLEVESVAWVAQRKSVLSTFLLVTTLAAYVRYAEKPCGRRYLALALSYSLALATKPMVVTMPILLMLFDSWPLRRRSGRLPWEKLPLAALALASAAVTFLVQEESKTGLATLPLAQRLANAVVTVVVYVRTALWPVGLAPLYPHPRDALEAWRVAGAAVIVLVASVVAWRNRHRRQYLWFGWAWYLVALVPVIGFVQVGRQSHADRYASVPLIGLFIAATFLAADLLAAARLSRRARAWVAGLGTGVLLAALCITTARQVAVWRDSNALFEHALAVTRNNGVAHYMLGVERARRGDLAEATNQMKAALALEPNDAIARVALATFRYQSGDPRGALLELNRAIELAGDVSDTYFRRGALKRTLGDTDGALLDLQKALELDEGNATARAELAALHDAAGRSEKARAELERAVRADPGCGPAWSGLGALAARAGDSARARDSFRRALDAQPDLVDAWRGLTLVELRDGRLAEAIELLQGTLRLEPNDVEAANNLAWFRATAADPSLRNPGEAIRLAERAGRSAGDANPGLGDTLAAAYAAAGRFPEAIATAERARVSALERGDKALADRIADRIERYRRGEPYVEGKTD